MTTNNTTKNFKHCPLIILGSGPAGYTAALYAARADISPIILSGPQKGGQLTTTTMVDNWPGAFDGIDGTTLTMNMQKHIERFNVPQIDDTIISVDFSVHPFVLIGQETRYTCDALIIATGASAKYLGLPSEKAFHGRGVSACATCDGFFFRKQEVAVVGGGNTAVEEAIYLSNICSKVTLIHRRDTLRAEKIEQEHLFELEKQGKINILWWSEVDEILGNDAGVTGLRIRNKKDGTTKELTVAGVFIAIGHEPNTKIFDGQLEMKQGYIQVRSGQSGFATQTSVAGIFAAGDVTDNIYRQAVISAGSGCMAALDAERFLQNQK